MAHDNELLDNIIMLAKKCQKQGKEIQAIHWFRKAINEYGKKEYEKDVMKLYLTGVAGCELKKEAKSYFAKIEEEEAKQFISKILAEKVTYPDSFINKMTDLLKYEAECVKRLREFKNVNDKKKEQKRVEEEHEPLVLELIKEKEKYSVKQTLFFECPFKNERVGVLLDYYQRMEEGYYLAGFGNTELSGYDYAYKTKCNHFSDSFVAGEMGLFIYDKKGKFVNREYPVGNEEQLYNGWFKGARAFTVSQLKQFLLDNEQYITLFCDWQYLYNNAGDTYSLTYYWDYDVRCLENGYSKYKSVSDNLDAYYYSAKDLTDLFLSIGVEGKYLDFRDYLVSDTFRNIASQVEYGFKYDYRCMKKAILIWHSKKIVGIVLAKQPADVIRLHGNVVRINKNVRKDGQPILCNKVDALIREKGSGWKHYVATTMFNLARQYKDCLPPIDITEEKPEGLPDDLWRFWIRIRYANPSV